MTESCHAQVVLPEGASDIRPSTPFPMQTSGDGRKFSYLDTTGRPVLILRKTNLVPDHNKDFSVTYQVCLARSTLAERASD